MLEIFKIDVQRKSIHPEKNFFREDTQFDLRNKF